MVWLTPLAGRWNPIFASPRVNEGDAKNEKELWALIFEKVHTGGRLARSESLRVAPRAERELRVFSEGWRRCGAAVCGRGRVAVWSKR
jgi:hypothetical protein